MLPKLLLCLSALAVATSGIAQNFTEEFRRTYNGSFNGNDLAVDVKSDAGGNIYVLGTTEVALNNPDFFLRKYNTAGAEVWTRTFGTTGVDVPKALRVDDSLNIYVMGVVPQSSPTDTQVLVRKMDSEGDQIYQTFYELSGDPGPDNGNDLVVDDSGNAYVAASSFQGLNGNMDWVVFKLSTTGVQLWQTIKAGPSNSNDSANALMEHEGLVYVAGVIRTVVSESDFTTVKLNAANAQQSWLVRQTQAHNDNAVARAIGRDSEGRIVVSGDLTRSDSMKSVLTVRLAEATGALLQPTSLAGDLGTVQFNATAMTLRGMEIGPDDFAYQVADGAYSGNTAIFQLFSVNGGYAGEGFPGNPAAGAAAAGDVVAGNGAGFHVGTVGSSTAAEGRNIFVARKRNGSGELNFEINGAASLEDVGVGIAHNHEEDLLVVGSSKAANGKFDILLVKLDQPPFALMDTYHAFEGALTLNVDQANGVKKNDLGGTGANANQNGSVEPVEAGYVNLQQNGSFTFGYPSDYSGTATFYYQLQKLSVVTLATPVQVHVHPLVNSLALPSQVVGGEQGVASVGFTGPEANEGYPGTLTSSNTQVLTCPSGFMGSSGQTSQDVPFQTSPVQAAVVVTVTASRGGSTVSNTVEVIPGGLTGLSVNPSSIIGGQSAQGTVTLSGNAGVGGTQIDLVSNSGSLTVPPSVVVAQSTSSNNFNVTTAAVNSTFVRTITAMRGLVTKTVNVTLKPAPKLSALAITPATVYGGQNATGTVTLTLGAAPGGTTVNLSDNSGSITTPANVVVAANATTNSFTLITADVAAAATRTVSASLDGISKTADLTLQPSPDLQSLVVSPSVVTGGQSTTGTVTLTATATVGSIVVAVGDNSGSISTPTTATVAQNTSSKAFGINTSSVGASATRQVTATLLGITKSANLSLHPSPTLTALSITPNSVKGGVSTTGKVTYNVPAGVGGNGTNLTDNSSAITTPASVTVPNGATQQTFTIMTSAVASTATRTVTATRNGVTKTANLTLTP